MDAEEGLKSKVESWLKKQGYAYEMIVAQSFMDAGLDVQQGETYTDPIEGKIREIDVLASHDWAVESEKFPGKLFMNLLSVIECKTTAERPWVVFTAPTGDYAVETCAQLRKHSTMGSEFEIGFKMAIWLSHLKVGHQFNIFKLGARTGFGITQALKTDNVDVTFSASTAVCQAVDGMIRTGLEKSDIVKKQEMSICTFYFPAIAVSSPLFECYLNEQKQPVLTEAKWIRMKFRGAVVDVVGKDGLIEYAGLMAAGYKKFEAGTKTLIEQCRTK